MTDLERLATLAKQLHEDDPPYPAPVPWHARNTMHLDAHAYYLCCCGKGFTDIASKRQHQLWCRSHSARESERNPSMQRMMGS